MADEVQIPPEVLETFLKIKRLVDTTVDQLQALPPLQLSASGTGSSTGTASIEVVGAPAVQGTARIPGASVSATAHPDVVRGKVSIPTPTVTVTDGPDVTLIEIPTVEEVRMARAWVDAMKTAGATAAGLGVPFGLRDLAELLLDIFP